MISIPTAASQIMAATGADRSTAMIWAWQCYREALAKQDAERRDFFLARRRDLRGERFRERLHAAGKITDIEHARRNSVGRTPAGMPVIFCEPREIAI